MTEAELEETPERTLARVIDRQARDLERLTAEVERLRGVVAERDQEIERMALRYGMRQLPALEEGE